MDYTQAIKLKPDYEEAYFLRGMAKSRLEDYRGAIADYTKVIELWPKFAAAGFCSRGAAKFELQDYRGAIIDCTQAIKLEPGYPEAYYHRGLAKLRLGRKNSGCLDLSKAGELGHYNAYDLIREHCN